MRGWTTVRLLGCLALLVTAGCVAVATDTTAADSPGALNINVYTCDASHDPIDPNQTLVNECAQGTEDIAFSLEPQDVRSGGSMTATTGTGGKPAAIGFSGLPAGDFRLTMQATGLVAQSYVAGCASNVREFTYPFGPFAVIEAGGRLNITLLPGEQLTCDWYNVLAPSDSAASSLVVTVYSCDGDIIDPALCDPAADIDLRLFNANAETVITSDASGVASFNGVGTFQIEPVSELPDRVFCGFQLTSGKLVDTLTLESGAPIAVEAYYCYPGA